MSQPEQSQLMRIVLHVMFFLSGIATVLIGPVLPILARHFSLSDIEMSYFFPAQFAGSISGTLLSSRLARRNNYSAAAVAGTLLMAVGLMLLNADSYSICLVGFLVNGLGIGLTLPSINMLILDMSQGRAASALSILNFCWGVGAIISKPFVDISGTRDSLGLATWILAVPLVMSAVIILPKVRLGRAVRDNTPPDDPRDARIWTTPIAWGIALFNLIHVGFESGMGGWITTYTERVDGQPLLAWLSPTFLYFLFFVLGRAFAPVLFRFVNENRMLLLGLTIVLAGMVFVLSAATVASLSIGAVAAGFGTSWIFPTNVARFSRTFGPRSTRRATPLFVAGTIGAASSTWLIGFVSERTGSLHSGLYVLAVGIALLIVLQIILGTRDVSPSEDS
ncbi:MAG: MFS transporter [Pyrinomonadaceae bacterium]|nr:MFS transporter [Pyrinomonadaceae bacterium]